MDFRTNAQVNWLMFRGVEPGPHKADYPYSSYFPYATYLNDGIHTSCCGHGVFSLYPAENARKPRCCHQLKENAHSLGARLHHTSDVETGLCMSLLVVIRSAGTVQYSSGQSSK